VKDVETLPVSASTKQRPTNSADAVEADDGDETDDKKTDEDSNGTSRFSNDVSDYDRSSVQRYWHAVIRYELTFKQ